MRPIRNGAKKRAPTGENACGEDMRNIAQIFQHVPEQFA